jgi:ACS family tartrate transporter-like MFS transporter
LTPEERAALAKASRRLIPFMGLLYVVSFLDRVNVGYAALTMNAEIGLSARAYGLGAGIFFIGYFLFEVPSNLILHRIGARIWIARILVTWGIISMAMASVQGTSSFLVLRFLLGVAEAGFFPGMILYLTYWFPPSVLGRMVSGFMVAVPVSNVIGAPLSTSLLSQSPLGLAGWQTMFIVEGAPAVLLGLVVMAWLPDRPAVARWLTNEERRCLENLVARDPRVPSRLIDGMLSPRVWLLAMVYFGLVVGLYGLGFWAPQIIQSLGALTLMQIGLMSAVPYAFAALAMVAWGLHSDATGERMWHLSLPALLGAAGFIASASLNNAYASLAALTVSAIGIYAALPVFWTLPAASLTGSAAAGGIALINSIGNLGGYLGPFAVGWLRDWTGGYSAGLRVLAVAMAAAGLIALIAGGVRHEAGR